jgi:hypothetical protein
MLLDTLREDYDHDSRFGFHILESVESLNDELDHVPQLVTRFGCSNRLLKVPQWNLALNSRIGFESSSKHAAAPWKRGKAQRIKGFSSGVESGRHWVLRSIKETSKRVDPIARTDDPYRQAISRRVDWTVKFQPLLGMNGLAVAPEQQ